MRGKVLDGYKDNPYYRITPAYAGKRASGFSLNLYIQDHPRLCGEKACMCAIGGVTAGSPPPMRGKAWVRGTSKETLNKSTVEKANR